MTRSVTLSTVSGLGETPGGVPGMKWFHSRRNDVVSSISESPTNAPTEESEILSVVGC